MTKEQLISYLNEKVQRHVPRQISQPDLAEAGVLIAIRPADEPTVILTKRAAHLSSHSGEVAFPGGKRDPEDHTIVATALREAHEEIGLCPSRVHVIGELDQVVSRFGYLVTPILSVVDATETLVASPSELESVFEVPLSLFQREPDGYFEQEHFKIPNFNYGEFHIWGLTAMMLSEMMNNFWHCNIEMKF